MGIYNRHTLAHHQFFTNVEPTIDNTRDFRIVFFPPYALVAFMALSLSRPRSWRRSASQRRMAAADHKCRSLLEL